MISRSRPRPETITILPKREPTPVTLHDGRVVDSWSEEWRLECEARAVLMMPGLHKRRSYLAHVESRRGEAAAAQLKAIMLALWSK